MLFGAEPVLLDLSGVQRASRILLFGITRTLVVRTASCGFQKRTMATVEKRGPKVGDSASLWNFTLVPGAPDA